MTRVKKIILVRGHSGSGKSTTADLIEQLSQGRAMRIESDMFRTTVDGVVRYSHKVLGVWFNLKIHSDEFPIKGMVVSIGSVRHHDEFGF